MINIDSHTSTHHDNAGVSARWMPVPKLPSRMFTRDIDMNTRVVVMVIYKHHGQSAPITK